MTNWFAKIKTWYEAGYWNQKMVGDAVKKQKITTEEYKMITGDDYQEE